MWTSYFVLSPLVNFLSAFGLAALFIWKRSKFRYYILFNLGIAFWSLFYLLWQLSGSYDQALFYCRFLMVGASFIPYFFMQFIIEYTENKKNTVWLSGVNLVLAVTFSALQFSNLIILKLEPVMQFPFWPMAGPVFIPYLMFFGGNVVLAHILLYKKYLITKNKDFLLVCIATAIAFSGGSTNFMLWIDIMIPPFGNIFIAIYVIIMAYAITKLNLLGISVIVKRGVSIIVTCGLVVGLYSILYWMFPVTGSEAFFGVCLITCGWSLFGKRIQEFLITTAERKFIKGWYNIDEEVNNLTRSLVAVYSKDDIFEALYNVLRRVEFDHYKIAATYQNKNLHGVEGELDAEEPLSYFFNYSDCIQAVNLPSGVLKIILKISTNPKIVVPLISKEGLEAILILEGKASGSKFSNQDLRFLQILQAQLNIIFDRIRPYEQIKTELIVAQEEAETAKAYAQKVAQQASFGTLTKGIAHELRNPLGMMMILSEALISEVDADASKEEVKEIADDIYKGTARLTEILDAMLEFGTAPDKQTHKRMAIKGAITSAAHLLEPKCKETKVQLSINCEDDLAIEGDSGLVSQIIFNLVLNSIQAIESKQNIEGQIDLHCFSDQENVVLKIKDNGCGIPDSDRDKIFDAYHTTKYENIGLGLSLVLQIVKSHKGKIEFESTGDIGTEFTLVFPKI